MELSSSDYVYPVKVVWKSILDDIYLTGVSYHRMSQILGVSWSTLNNWRDGHEPRHSYGDALLHLHTQCCGEELTKLRQREGQVVV